MNFTRYTKVPYNLLYLPIPDWIPSGLYSPTTKVILDAAVKYTTGAWSFVPKPLLLSYPLWAEYAISAFFEMAILYFYLDNLG